MEQYNNQELKFIKLTLFKLLRLDFYINDLNYEKKSALLNIQETINKVREDLINAKNIDEIKDKLQQMKSPLNKLTSTSGADSASPLEITITYAFQKFIFDDTDAFFQKIKEKMDTQCPNELKLKERFEESQFNDNTLMLLSEEEMEIATAPIHSTHCNFLLKKQISNTVNELISKYDIQTIYVQPGFLLSHESFLKSTKKLENALSGLLENTGMSVEQFNPYKDLNFSFMGEEQVNLGFFQNQTNTIAVSTKDTKNVDNKKLLESTLLHEWIHYIDNKTYKELKKEMKRNASLNGFIDDLDETNTVNKQQPETSNLKDEDKKLSSYFNGNNFSSEAVSLNPLFFSTPTHQNLAHRKIVEISHFLQHEQHFEQFTDKHRIMEDYLYSILGENPNKVSPQNYQEMERDGLLLLIMENIQITTRRTENFKNRDENITAKYIEKVLSKHLNLSEKQIENIYTFSPIYNTSDDEDLSLNKRRFKNFYENIAQNVLRNSRFNLNYCSESSYLKESINADSTYLPTISNKIKYFSLPPEMLARYFEEAIYGECEIYPTSVKLYRGADKEDTEIAKEELIFLANQHLQISKQHESKLETGIVKNLTNSI